MWVKLAVPECDFTGRKYRNHVNGAGAVVRGATGRWCVVMYAGPEYLDDNGIDPMSRERAIELVENDPINAFDYADF